MGIQFQICTAVDQNGEIITLAPCDDSIHVHSPEILTGLLAFKTAFNSARTLLGITTTDNSDTLLESCLNINRKLESILKESSSENDLITFYVNLNILNIIGFKFDTLTFGSVLCLNIDERYYGGPTINTADEIHKQGVTSYVLLPYTIPDYSVITNYDVLQDLTIDDVLEVVLTAKEINAFKQESKYTNKTVGINDSMILVSRDMQNFDFIRYYSSIHPVGYLEYSKICQEVANLDHDVIDISVTDNFDVDIHVECKPCAEADKIVDTVYKASSEPIKSSMCNSTCSRPSACNSSSKKTNTALYLFLFAAVLVLVIFVVVRKRAKKRYGRKSQTPKLVQQQIRT